MKSQMETFYLHSLDIGTTKTTSMIAEADYTGNCRLLGYASVRSKGLRNSRVINNGMTTESICAAVMKSQQMAGVNVERTIVGIAGGHIKSINSRGVVSIAGTSDSLDEPLTIEKSDVERAINAAMSINFASDSKIIHSIPREYTIDDNRGIRSPIGLTGRRLEVSMHLISSSLSELNNLTHCVELSGLHLEEFVLESIASADSVLTEDEKGRGVVLIDIGGGTTDIAVFQNGSLSGTAEVEYGGEIVSSDIAMLFNISLEEAERIKVRYGSVLTLKESLEPIKVNRDNDLISRYILPIDLNRVIQARMSEILEMSAKLIQPSLAETRYAGIVITGGSSQFEGLTNLTEEIFNKPARVGIPMGIKGIDKDLKNPAFATVSGLTKWGANSISLDLSGGYGESSAGKQNNFKKLFSWLSN